MAWAREACTSCAPQGTRAIRVSLATAKRPGGPMGAGGGYPPAPGGGGGGSFSGGGNMDDPNNTTLFVGGIGPMVRTWIHTCGSVHAFVLS